MTLGVVGITKNLLGECRPRAWNDATGACDAVGRGRERGASGRDGVGPLLTLG